MDARTLLLTLHIAAASWLGADVLVPALTPRLERDPSAAPAWARAQVWLHNRYYPSWRWRCWRRAYCWSSPSS